MITSVLDLSRANRSSVLDSMKNPPFLSGYWRQLVNMTSRERMIAAMKNQEAGLPGGFHRAAHDIYQRIARFKGADPVPAVGEVLDALRTRVEAGDS